MKRALVGFLQFLLFFALFAAGSLLNPFHLRWFVTHPTPLTTRDFSPGGLILVLLVYVLILLVEALRKRLAQAATLTSIAVILALILGCLAGFGFATHELY